MFGRLAAGVLAVVGVLLLVAGIVAGVARYEVLDSARFTATADELRRDPQVAAQLGNLVADRIVEANPGLRALRPLVQRTAASVIASDSLSPLVAQAVAPVHTALVTGRAGDAVLQLNQVGAQVVSALRTVRPDLVLADPGDLTIGQQAAGLQSSLQKIADAGRWLTLVSWLGPMIGVLLLAVAGALRRPRLRGAVRWVGIGLICAAAVLAALVALGGLVARSVSITSVATATLHAAWPQSAPTFWLAAGIVALIGVLVTAFGRAGGATSVT